jgi:hypothetical protein
VGFAKGTAPPDAAVRGPALDDEDFEGGGDRVRYIVPAGSAAGPFHVTVALYYQSIAMRWAQNLALHAAPETSRFVSYYRAMAGSSAVRVAHAEALVRPRPG